MLSVTRIAPGAGITYLTQQVATGRHDFRPAASSSVVAYHADPAANGEAPGWWAGQSHALFGLRGEVTEPQMRNLIGEGKHPVSGEQLGRLWRQYVPMDDAARTSATETAWGKLPADATYEQVAQVWLSIWTAPERRPVAGFDVTVSPVKSVSLLWAFGDDHVKQQVMAAHHEGVRATLEHLRAHGAFTRTGTNGITQVDTDGLAAMVFDHRMSREQDPQLHSHIIVSSKVRVVRDGREQWLALDSRAFYQASIGARVAYERAVENELGKRLGVRFAERANSPIREIVGISARALVQYAKRRAAIEAEMTGRATTPGSGRQGLTIGRWRRSAQDATLSTRPVKHGTESTRQAVARWRREDRAAGLDTTTEVRQIVSGRVLDDVDRDARRVIRHAVRERPARELSVENLNSAALDLGIDRDDDRARMVNAAIRRLPHLAVERAVADVTAQRAVFRIDHLELALGRILHVAPTARRADWQDVQRLAARAVRTRTAGLRVLTPPALVEWGPSLLRGSDRQSIYSRHRDLVFSTEPVLNAEKDFIAYAARRGATAAPNVLLDRVADDLDLSVEKRTALHAVLGDDRRVTGIVGPAGTGKTYLQRAVAAAGHEAGVPVLGLTVGQNAAFVLAAATADANGKGGIRTENIAMWLHAQHSPPEGTTTADWAFAPGQWVIVDEASQVSTPDLVHLAHLLEPVAGKLILVGDPEQISAIGPGGMFRYLASLGNTVELREVRRFTDVWEGPASLRLRAGDTTVLAEYDRRGRVMSGDRETLTRRVIDGWTADILQGRTSLILVETEADAAVIAAQARRSLIRAGVVPAGRTVQLGNGTKAGVGDTVVTRRNDRELAAGGLFVANRDQWKVLELGPDGELLVENTTTRAATTLPADYVAQHVQLAYAATVDSAQGRTVDVARALVDEATSRARLYVMATRGRLLNLLAVIVNDEPPEGHPTQQPSAGVTVLAEILRADSADRSTTETERTLWADADSLHFWGPVYDDLTARATAGQYIAVVRGAAGTDVAARLAADPAMPALAQRLNALAAAGHDPLDVLRSVTASRELDSAQDVAAVLAWRIDTSYKDLQPDPRIATSPAQAASFTARIVTTGDHDLADALRQVAERADRRVETLADLAALRQPTWAQALGAVPEDEAGHKQWLSRAAVVATYRDRYAVTGDEPIGPEPSTRDPIRWGAWQRAHIVLGIATLAGQVAAAPDYELRELVALQRSTERRAPDYVAGALRVAHTELAAAEQHLRASHLELAAAQKRPDLAEKQATGQRQRWWATSPLGVRDAIRQHPTTATLELPREDLQRLQDNLQDARSRVDTARTKVDVLEQRHHTWTNWYTTALPTRYAGLAAAAELTRRAHRTNPGMKDLISAVRDTTAKIRAVDATQPRPHQRPVPEHLTEDADHAHDRLLDHDIDTHPELDGDLELETDPTLD
ncbi:MobF family relaxase [Actinoplanes sp. NPDC051859]|uniref:MobF family relaxase n=1 Tax=Actinoplanes sp. NPDC051859 TaxID=3363909 RepID=UPI0037A00B48